MMKDPENLDEELKPLVTAWSHLGPFLDLGPPALGLAV